MDYLKVELGINADAITGRLWQRLQRKQPAAEVGGYRSFADCFRTSATVSGINPGATGQKEELRLPTGTVNVMSKLEATERKVLDTPAARAEASFFLYAFPKFLEALNAEQNRPGTWAGVVTQLERYGRLMGESQTQAGPVTYKAILRLPDLKKRFSEMFGINDDISPAVGTAMTQVNDPTEKAEAEEQGQEKWNFHWAGVIMTDGKDYVTLENCAVEIPDATAAEIAANSDIVREGPTPQQRTVTSQSYSKQDLINDRWYFKLYGPGAASFHAKNLADTHATPSAITLPVSKRV